MRHLFSSTCEILRMTQTFSHGSLIMGWSKVDDLLDEEHGIPGEVLCRLDLNFVRPGKDAPAPVVAGRAPDRMGVMFCSITGRLLAGDRVRTIDGPVTGTFEIRAIPDTAVDAISGHHIEVGVVEVAQSLAGVFPGSEPGD